MIYLSIILFVAGYIAIAFENQVHLNKAASALITGALCWIAYMLSQSNPEFVNEQLLHHLGDIASILFFLMGAMTIVELIDGYNGFDIITRKMATNSKTRLLIMVTIVAFFLSAALDNLTTAIVMCTLIKKLLPEKNDRLYFSGMVIIAANAGGTWSPIGDVTTTMLWIGGQITATTIIIKTFFPALAVCVVPMSIIAYKFRRQKIQAFHLTISTTNQKRGKIMLSAGFALLLFVPVLKSVTHLPPFIGMILALGILWIITTFFHLQDAHLKSKPYSVSSALQKIDTPSVLFFLGILLSVAALQSFGVLDTLASILDTHLKNDQLIATVLGLLSAIVDNVPLVAATQGMYHLHVFPIDHSFWQFLALTTGTGGSLIIIGSAAGIAAMGIEKINFTWYLKHISWLALLGFLAGMAVFLLQ